MRSYNFLQFVVVSIKIKLRFNTYIIIWLTVQNILKHSMCSKFLFVSSRKYCSATCWVVICCWISIRLISCYLCLFLKEHELCILHIRKSSAVANILEFNFLRMKRLSVDKKIIIIITIILVSLRLLVWMITKYF